MPLHSSMACTTLKPALSHDNYREIHMIIRTHPLGNQYLVVSLPRSHRGGSCARPKIVFFNAGADARAPVMVGWQPLKKTVKKAIPQGRREESHLYSVNGGL